MRSLILVFALLFSLNVWSSQASVKCLSDYYGDILFSFDVIEIDDELREIELEKLKIKNKPANIESQYFNGHRLHIMATEVNPFNPTPSSFLFILNPYQKYFGVTMYDYGHYQGQEPEIREVLRCEPPEF